MTTFVPFNRDQAFLLPPDLKDWLPEDDLAHFVVAAVERVPLGSFKLAERTGGKPQYHPRLMRALLIYSYANGIFSSRRIERASYRDIGVRFVAANTHPDHDTIAEFRRGNRAAFEAAFVQVLLLARQSGLLRLGTVSIDGTKIDANASKRRSVRYDRAKQLRAKLAADIAALTARAETADAQDTDPQALPAEIARRCQPRSPGARASRPSSTKPVTGSKPRRAPRQKPSARPTRPSKPPMTPSGVGADARPNHPMTSRRRRGKATSPTRTAC